MPVLRATPGVLSIMVAPGADRLDMELVFSVVAARVVVFMAVEVGEHFVAAVEAWQIVRVRDASPLDEVVDASARLPPIAVSGRFLPTTKARSSDLRFALDDVS